MRTGPELRLWTEGAWRCEYWLVDDKGQLRLYRHADLKRSHNVSEGGGKAALALSASWRSEALRDNPQPN